MSNVEEHYQTLLGIVKPWEVRLVSEYVESREIRVVIRLREGVPVECPRCGNSATLLPNSGEKKKGEGKLIFGKFEYKLLVDCEARKCCCEKHGELLIPTPLDEVDDSKNSSFASKEKARIARDAERDEEEDVVCEDEGNGDDVENHGQPVEVEKRSNRRADTKNTGATKGNTVGEFTKHAKTMGDVPRPTFVRFLDEKIEAIGAAKATAKILEKLVEYKGAEFLEKIAERFPETVGNGKKKELQGNRYHDLPYDGWWFYKNLKVNYLAAFLDLLCSELTGFSIDCSTSTWTVSRETKLDV